MNENTFTESLRVSSESQDVNPVVTGIVVGIAVATIVVGSFNVGKELLEKRRSKKNAKIIKEAIKRATSKKKED